MIQKLHLEHILFLDIETVPEVEEFDALSPVKKQLWEQKTHYQRKQQFTPEAFYPRAGIWAEFGKIICISVGHFSFKGSRKFNVLSFCGTETIILSDFSTFLRAHFNRPKHLLCAHNGKEFDFPYITRRMVVNGLEIPEKLNLFGKKPWEVTHLDTLELWKFGDYKHYTSLNLLTNILNIPSPKDDIEGSEVAQIYYIEKDIDRIISYCEKDTVAVAQIILRLRREPLLKNSEIIHTKKNPSK